MLLIFCVLAKVALPRQFDTQWNVKNDKGKQQQNNSRKNCFKHAKYTKIFEKTRPFVWTGFISIFFRRVLFTYIGFVFHGYAKVPTSAIHEVTQGLKNKSELQNLHVFTYAQRMSKMQKKRKKETAKNWPTAYKFSVEQNADECFCAGFMSNICKRTSALTPSKIFIAELLQCEQCLPIEFVFVSMTQSQRVDRSENGWFACILTKNCKQLKYCAKEANLSMCSFFSLVNFLGVFFAVAWFDGQMPLLQYLLLSTQQNSLTAPTEKKTYKNQP